MMLFGPAKLTGRIDAERCHQPSGFDDGRRHARRNVRPRREKFPPMSWRFLGLRIFHVQRRFMAMPGEKGGTEFAHVNARPQPRNRPLRPVAAHEQKLAADFRFQVAAATGFQEFAEQAGTGGHDILGGDFRPQRAFELQAKRLMFAEQHFLRGFGADDQHSAHAVARVFVVDGAVTVSEIGFVQRTVPE
jgi:hypothetical protein